MFLGLIQKHQHLEFLHSIYDFWHFATVIWKPHESYAFLLSQLKQWSDQAEIKYWVFIVIFVLFVGFCGVFFFSLPARNFVLMVLTPLLT